MLSKSQQWNILWMARRLACIYLLHYEPPTVNRLFCSHCFNRTCHFCREKHVRQPTLTHVGRISIINTNAKCPVRHHSKYEGLLNTMGRPASTSAKVCTWQDLSGLLTFITHSTRNIFDMGEMMPNSVILSVENGIFNTLPVMYQLTDKSFRSGIPNGDQVDPLVVDVKTLWFWRRIKIFGVNESDSLSPNVVCV